MKEPLLYRKQIPLFHAKTEVEYQQDAYESYHSMVQRQSVLHLADAVWGAYPWQAVYDFAEPYVPPQATQIVEVGCGVGRWIADLAQQLPDAQCWGIDYSYQMLKRANEFWVKGKNITIDLSSRGFSGVIQQQGTLLGNLQFGLAKAAHLPFDSQTQNLVVSSFLIDRVNNPMAALSEMYRILQTNGLLIVLSPLNFKQANHWSLYYPPVKLMFAIQQVGFSIVAWQENIIINEPLDIHGNAVQWKCLGFVAKK